MNDHPRRTRQYGSWRDSRPGTPSLPAWSTLLRLGAVILFAGSVMSCGGGDAVEPPNASTPTSTALKVVTFAANLSHPWSLAFLPDHSMLVTERAGRMRHISADGKTMSPPFTGIPPVFAEGQGGLLDVALDPDYASTPWVYWSYAEEGQGSEAGLAGTAVARGQLVGTDMRNVEVIFRQSPKLPSTNTNHFGSRLVFARDKTLFIVLGERHQDDPAHPGTLYAQNLSTDLGKVVRIERDGSIPGGNPNFGVAGARPELWSYGHRNPQGAALNPETGELWLVEHGPQGGDELNRIQPGRNYGWPLRSYGCPYGSPVGDACRVGGGTHAPDFEEPITYWVPTSIAPSGLTFYTANNIPQWQGSVFTGALAGQALWRLTLQGNTVTAREALFQNELGRIRDVRQGPDGWLYLLTDSDDGRILRIESQN